uniref:Uncharacterized protein n=1 Tax=Musca domestica TaxID=7370 RepID=A0A1I8ME33_MUSDO
MLSTKQLVILGLLGCLSTLQAGVVLNVNPGKSLEEPAVKHLKVSPVNANEVPVLKELKSVQKTKSGDTLYGFVCTVGQIKTDSLGCVGSDSVAWPSEQNVELTVSCDKSNVGRIITYVEVHFVVSTQNVGCNVSAGSIGTSSIEVKVYAAGTNYLEYSSLFYKI